jgi:hypothetical protein
VKSFKINRHYDTVINNMTAIFCISPCALWCGGCVVCVVCVVCGVVVCVVCVMYVMCAVCGV